MIDPSSLDWEKMNGLIPAIVQDTGSGQVRMVGYMDRAALEATLRDSLVTFQSRSKGGSWRKGATSGNLLEVVDVRVDCDGDALLILADPRGPTCHRGSASCFGNGLAPFTGFLAELEKLLEDRASADPATSYTARLIQAGTKRIAQKVGEEAVETSLAAVSNDIDDLTAEVSDLIYHLTVLLIDRGLSWSDVIAELNRRQLASKATTSL